MTDGNLLVVSDQATTVCRPWRTPRLPDLVGAKEAALILGVRKMTLLRWMEPQSGYLGPEQTYMIPPARIDAGPVWVRSDVEKFAAEVGPKRVQAPKRVAEPA